MKGLCGFCDEFATFASTSGGVGGCMSAGGGVAEPAPRLTQMASWLDGVTAPICQRDWGSTFASFPSFPERRVREPTRFILDANPDSGTLQVEVDGERHDAEGGGVWLYDPTEREVVFTPRGRPLPGPAWR